jgi:hypothetical protein
VPTRGSYSSRAPGGEALLEGRLCAWGLRLGDDQVDQHQNTLLLKFGLGDSPLGYLFIQLLELVECLADWVCCCFHKNRLVHDPPTRQIATPGLLSGTMFHVKHCRLRGANVKVET